MSGKSKFAGLFEAAKEREPTPAPEPPETSATNTPGSFVASTPVKRGPGRPNGKRSNPDFEQVTAYIRKDTYKAVKVRLLQEEPERDFSELVGELLTNWLDLKT